MPIFKLAKKINSSLRPWLKIVIILALFTVIASYANFRSSTIYDPDSFYHIRHSWIYKETGITHSDFPWVQYSVIKESKADLWYGFHIILIPFTFFSDLTLGIKIAGFFITFLVLLLFYISLKNLGVYFPALWSSFFIFSSPIILYRMAMTRPHPISLALSVLIFSFLLRGKWWPILVLSFLISWIHSSMFWLPPLIFAVIALFKTIDRQKIDLAKFLALTAGLIGGLLTRPNPIANLKLIYIQTVQLYASKAEVLNQIIGGELKSPTLGDLKTNFTFLAIFLAGNIFLLVLIFYRKDRLPINVKTAALSSLAIALISVLMYINANRAIDILGAFTIVFGGVIISHYISNINAGELDISDKRSHALAIFIILFLTFTAINSIFKENFDIAKLRTAYKEPAIWLKENTKEGEIVFNPVWSQFPILFFWNQHNYYINGMDPIFLYAYNQKLYWEVFYIHAKDMGGLTCSSMVCGPDQIEPVYDALVRDFKASYVFVRKITNPRFQEYMESDKKHFRNVYHEGQTVIYKVLLPEK